MDDDVRVERMTGIFLFRSSFQSFRNRRIAWDSCFSDLWTLFLLKEGKEGARRRERKAIRTTKAIGYWIWKKDVKQRPYEDRTRIYLDRFVSFPFFSYAQDAISYRYKGVKY